MVTMCTMTSDIMLRKHHYGKLWVVSLSLISDMLPIMHHNLSFYSWVRMISISVYRMTGKAIPFQSLPPSVELFTHERTLKEHIVFPAHVPVPRHEELCQQFPLALRLVPDYIR